MNLPDVALTDAPLNAAAALAQVNVPGAGGIDLFLGITRAEDSPQGPLVGFEYHAYPEMAVSQIQQLINKARQQWPICRAIVWHRTGMVNVGEPSVVIVVSTPHRAESFEACRYLIDELKKLAPIWKREIYAQGAKWQGETGVKP